MRAAVEQEESSLMVIYSRHIRHTRLAFEAFFHRQPSSARAHIHMHYAHAYVCVARGMWKIVKIPLTANITTLPTTQKEYSQVIRKTKKLIPN